MSAKSISSIETLPLIPGYTLHHEIGRGATAIVYLATRGEQKFAIKVMNPEEGDEAVKAGLRFRKEASAIARINHSTLVKIFEVGEHNSLNFVVMELVEGSTLTELITAKSLNETDIVAIILQVAQGLTSVHRLGMIHRDIKPDNILIAKNRTVRLIDFGFAASTQGNFAEEAAGTLLYCPPEYFGNENGIIDGRSDLYSLGVVFYQCIVGYQPFQSENSTELIKMHINNQPKNLLQAKPNITPVISLICHKLLEKKIDDRYQSAEGLTADLESIANLEIDLQAGNLELDSKRGRIKVAMDVPLIGREQEVEDMRAVWRSVQDGNGQLLQIEGEGGSGKSRLTLELLKEIEIQGAYVFRGKCQSAESTILGVVREAFDDFFVRLARIDQGKRNAILEKFKTAAGQSAPVLKRLCRAFGKLFSEVPDAGFVDPAIERTRLFSATVEFLNRLSKEFFPVVFVIDDIQWIDEGSAELFKSISLGLDGHRILLLTTARNDSNSSKSLEKFLNQMSAAQTKRISLQPLKASAVGRFTELFLGGGKLEEKVIERLTTSSRGNIFVVREYIRNMLDSAAIYPTNEGWHVNFDTLTSLTLSENVLDLVVSRINALNSETQVVLGAASLIGIKFSMRILSKSSGLTAGAVMQAMNAAQRENLVEPEDGDYYSLVHDRVLEALRKSLTDEKKAEIHQSIADAMKEQPEDSIEYVFSLARHVINGYPQRTPEFSYLALVQAGQAALASYDNDQALKFFQKSLELGDMLIAKNVNYLEIYSGLGQASYLKAQFKDAHSFFQKALSVADTPITKAKTCNAISMIYDKTDETDEAWKWFMNGCAELGETYPSSKIKFIFKFLWSALYVWFLENTGFFFGSQKAEKIQQSKTLAELFETGTTTAVRYQDIGKMLFLALRNVVNAHYLGATREYAVACSQCLGWALSMIGLKKSRYWGWKGVGVAEQLGDKALLVACRLRLINILGLSGDFASYDKLVTSVFADYDRYLYGHRHGMAGTLAHTLTLHARGHTKTLNDFGMGRLPFMLKYGNFSYTVAFGYALQFGLFRVGRTEEANGIAEHIRQSVSQTKYSAALVQFHESNTFVRYWIEQGADPALEAELESHISNIITSRQIQFYYMREAPLTVAYARLIQLVRMKNSEKVNALKEFKKLLKKIWFFSTRQAVHKAHWCNLMASYHREMKAFDKAFKYIQVAKKNARESNNIAAQFEIHINLSTIYQQLEKTNLVISEVEKGFDIAAHQGWILRQSILESEFAEAFQNISSQKLKKLENNSKSEPKVVESYLDALLRVSVASASSLGSEQQAIAALDELIKALHAERAFLFVIDEKAKSPELQLIMRAGRDSAGNNLPELQGYSSTVVNKALTEKKAIIVSGSEEGELIGSKSAVIHNLRSIMAAPLKVNNELLGVVYIDNRMIKGLFTPEHISFLSAVANHLAINIKLVSMAQMEIEKKSIEKDLEMVATVQSLFLPENRYFKNEKFALCGTSIAASGSGGDWWWYQKRGRDGVSIYVGDVTGHGPGPAMLTASSMAQLRLLKELNPDITSDQLLKQMNDEFTKISKGQFYMTMIVVDIDDKMNIRWWNAAAPTIYILRISGDVESLSLKSSLIGVAFFEVATSELKIQKGDRIIIATDGLEELQTETGKQIAFRALTKLFKKTKDLSTEEAMAFILSEVHTLRGSVPLADDLTIVIVDAFEDSQIDSEVMV